jgi:hypothetical protein|tara:strand:- start:570 stop:695 length:126 start_codon:yes stop_codon:yes gene_type:complete
MEKIEKARRLFEVLESKKSNRPVEIARRAFYIQERLSEIKN